MGKKQIRLNEILSLINARGRISMKELAPVFEVTELTIRRDIKVLEQQGLVQNIRGVVFASGNNPENKIYNLNVAGTKNFDAKDKIGRYAAGLIEADDVVIIDNGTTTERMAVHISEDINITALCYNINILNCLYKKPNISLIFAGGYFHQQTLMFESKESLELIRRTRATKVFVSAAGVHDPLGVTCASTYELESKREILKASMEKILLVDSSKFGQVHKNYICEFKIYHKIITDCGISEEWKQKITEAGVELIIV